MRRPETCPPRKGHHGNLCSVTPHYVKALRENTGTKGVGSVYRSCWTPPGDITLAHRKVHHLRTFCIHLGVVEDFAEKVALTCKQLQNEDDQ
eukprot:g77439.t1